MTKNENLPLNERHLCRKRIYRSRKSLTNKLQGKEDSLIGMRHKRVGTNHTCKLG